MTLDKTILEQAFVDCMSWFPCDQDEITLERTYRDWAWKHMDEWEELTGRI